MKIVLQDISKRYIKSVIFKNLSFTIESGDRVVIKGSNGSGKSTLLKLIAGIETPTKGKITYYINNQEVYSENLFHYISVCTPYMELFEELTLQQMIDFHFKMKNPLPTVSTSEIPQLILLENELNKEISEFSSGMKQRLKLGLAILSNAPLLLLDEPSMNLDSNGVEWYKNIIRNYASEKTIVVCSNQIKDEYDFCNKEIHIEDFK
ncbi:MAG: ABC transporter ATP-binding protein [Bacteroidetes bacterium]|nr:MAG: ABC transporter ATP-binding protein [Bacteroidota bacterium]